MDYDYSKRHYLLPDGCKDLIDVIQPMTTVTEWGFVVTVLLPERELKNLEITAIGSTLRIITRPSNSSPLCASTIEVPVPGDYALAKAQATYFHDRLRIVVPLRWNQPDFTIINS